ncbi:hypothetical protein J6TS1_23950 [Siminovitchia terrae]|uniref:Uncharacterized protein n=1 Tax=Siminovitchia terrae TaxID=1914933 RepID=A0A429X4E2_SIMTE|nr:hypothetical protein [Siminovitchia terrae]RST58221.1 hypothetical protein D5F11_018280 [Siminovitchia terrae]GIN92038.1 hypothetical protein J22TS1_30890 [Siminovitchia terrae]GIN96525.1 hypothetical protein J6TS1_23950 [Siminovitchia terrae]
MKKWMAGFYFLLTAMLLSGCFYPEDRKVENNIPYEEQIDSVQRSVEKFQEETGGLLPIKTKEADTPIYQKYPIDFKKLIPQYLETPPGNAYESGGVFQYVLIDVETNPTVKVFDVRLAEKVNEFYIRIRSQGYPPFKEEVADNVYSLDQKKLGYKEEQYYTSPYTNNNLPFVINGKGEIYVDYISDLYQVLKDEKKGFSPGEDIRKILYKDSPIVPAFSMPYTVDENNEPVYMGK